MTIATTSERFLAAPSRPSHPARSALIQSKGAGKARPPLRPAARLRKKMQAAGTTGPAGATRPSLRDGLTLTLRSPRCPA
ncbi:MAG: hypothetical protein EKK32_07800 [Bradyrhizobiaceae bacterium]|nr:MAG: hypothetical protein EKK32_07800 [Bradyrhizobiaceae bacterium]